MGVLNSDENQSEGESKLKSRAYRLVSNRTEQENQRRRVKPLHRSIADEDT
jgi:hypothetical protein